MTWRPTLRRAPHRYPSLHFRYSHDLANVLGLKLFGVHARNGEVSWNRRQAFFSACVILSPIAVAVLLLPVARPPGSRAAAYFAWLGYFSFLCFLAILLSRIGVSFVHRLTPDLERTLTPSGLEAYEKWADLATSTGLQAIFAGIFAVLATACLAIADIFSEIERVFYVSPASYLSLLISGVFLSGGAYWIFQGTILSYKLTRPGMMSLSPYAPAETPGLERLAMCYTLAFYGACLGVLLCLIPILSWAYSIEQSGALTILKFALFAVCVGSTTAIAVIPHWCLTEVVATKRQEMLTEIRASLPHSPKLREEVTPREAYLLSWLQSLAASPSSTISGAAISSFLIGAAIASIPFLIQVLHGS